MIEVKLTDEDKLFAPVYGVYYLTDSDDGWDKACVYLEGNSCTSGHGFKDFSALTESYNPFNLELWVDWYGPYTLMVPKEML